MDPSICPNCGNPDVQAFCPQCGQRQMAGKTTFGSLLGDLLSGITEADSRLFRTLKKLIFHPGSLTVAFFDGHRVRYMHPFRLYLLASILFFLTAAISARLPYLPENIDRISRTFDYVKQAAKTDSSDAVPQTDPDPANDKSAVAVATDPADSSPAGGPQVTVGNLTVRLDTEELRLSLLQNIGTTMFFLVPLFGAIINLFYFRQRQFYYSDHLIFLLHVHSFAFLLMIPAVIFHRWIAMAGAILIIIVYLFLAARRVYQQSRLWTTAKVTIISITYMVVLFIFFVLAAFATAFVALMERGV